MLRAGRAAHGCSAAPRSRTVAARQVPLGYMLFLRTCASPLAQSTDGARALWVPEVRERRSDSCCPGVDSVNYGARSFAETSANKTLHAQSEASGAIYEVAHPTAGPTAAQQAHPLICGKTQAVLAQPDCCSNRLHLHCHFTRPNCSAPHRDSCPLNTILTLTRHTGTLAVSSGMFDKSSYS